MATTVSLQLNDGRVTVDWNLGGFDVAPAGDHDQGETLTIGTSEETVAINADITGGNGPGYLVIKNLDATNFLSVGHATASYMLRINAGKSNILSLAAGITNLYMLADTGNVKVRYWLLER